MPTRRLAALGLILPALAGTVHTGSLDSGDARLPAGEYADTYEVELAVGQPFEADLTSSDFDPYLVLRAPSGETEENDDYLGSTMQARIVTTAAEAGTYTVFVTSYAAGETGAYRLEIEEGRAPVVTPPPPTSADRMPPRDAVPPAAGPVSRSDLVGHWTGGAPGATQYRDRATGASAPMNGVGTTLDLAADGTYRQSRVMNQTSYSCTSTVNVDERGTWAVERGELVLRRRSGRSWGQTCGGPRYDRMIEAETVWFGVTIAPGRGGVATLTRRQYGEAFDQLERSR